MSRSLEILGTDQTERVFSTGTDSASIADLIGQISKRRRFRLRDNNGSMNPLNPSGFFAINDWRNGEIEYKNQDGQTQFAGAMKEISSMQQRGTGYTVTVNAIENTGTLLNFPIEENDKTTHAGFLLSAAGSAGDTTISVDTGTTSVPVGALISFGAALVPRYQATAATGSPTTSITLDRGLETDIADNTALLVSVPVERTIPDAIRLTLEVMGLADRLDTTFATLAAEDTAAGAQVRLNIVVEENIKAAEHLGKLLELMNGILTVNNDGMIGLIRGLEYRGQSVESNLTLTDKEVIADVEITSSTSSGPGLLIGYDCLYSQADGNTVGVVSDTTTAARITKWAPSKRWQPIPQNGQISGAYNYLYADLTSATYYAGPVLDYYSVPRYRIKCACKGSVSGEILRTLDHQIGSFYFLNMTVAPGVVLNFEPVRVVSYVRDLEKNLYPSIEFEMVNRLSPNLPVDAQLPVAPTIQTTLPIYNGFASVFDTLPDSQNIVAQIYDSGNVLIQTVVFNSDARSIDPNGQYIQFTGLTNGLTYSIQFATATGAITSEFTDPVSIIPADQGFLVGNFGVGVFTV